MSSVFLGRFLFPGAIPLSNLLAGNVSLEIVRDSLVEYFFRYILVVIPLHFFGKYGLFRVFWKNFLFKVCLVKNYSSDIF